MTATSTRFAVVQSLDSATWDIGRILYIDVRWSGSSAWKVANEASFLRPSAFASASTDVISSIRPDGTAATRRHPGPAFLVGTSDSDLREGDLLLPSNGLGGAYIVKREDIGRYFSSTFHSLRFDEPELAVTLWALWNADTELPIESGITGRVTTDAIQQLVIPELQESVIGQLLLLNNRIKLSSPSVTSSWWDVRTIPNGPWDVTLAARDLSILNTELTLSDLGEIIPSHYSDRNGEVSHQEGEFIPLANAAYVQGGAVKKQIHENAPSIKTVDAGTLIVSTTGKLQARVAEQKMALHSSVVGIVLHNVSDTQVLANYLNGPDAKEAFTALATGSVLPRLNIQQFREFPVPTDFSFRDYDIPLSVKEELERILWS